MPAYTKRGLPRKTFVPIEQQFNTNVRLVTISPNGAAGCYDAVVDGELVVQSSKQPFLDAARVLLSRNIDSNSVLRVRHAGSSVNALIAKIGVAGKLTVAEDDRGPPRFRSWKPFPSREVASPVRSNGSALSPAENAL